MSKTHRTGGKQSNEAGLGRRTFLWKSAGAGVALGSIGWPKVAAAAKTADPRVLVRRVADAVMRDFPEPPPFN